MTGYDVMAFALVTGIREQSSNTNLICYVYFHSNTIMKGVLLSPIYELNSWVDKPH